MASTVNRLIFPIAILTGIVLVEGSLTCHYCEGINCLRSTYMGTQECTDAIDVCATIFQGQTVQAQGCLAQISSDLQAKCNPGKENKGDMHISDCQLCNSDLCNNLASSKSQCIQCDSKNDINCRNNPEVLSPTPCPISRAANSYCYWTLNGQRVIRGCAGTLIEQRNCMNKSECRLCSPNEISGCNNARVGNGSDSGGETVNAGKTLFDWKTNAIALLTSWFLSMALFTNV